MAHPAGQVFQHVIHSDAKPADTGLAAAFSRFQCDDLGVVHGPIIAGLLRPFSPFLKPLLVPVSKLVPTK